MPAPEEPDATDEDAFDPDARRLCPDGACTGVLGDDGRCKVCGAVGGPPNADAPARAAPALEGDEPADASARSDHSGDDSGDGGAFDHDDRRLCPDGSCIGLVGDDGRCKVCGTVGDAPREGGPDAG